MFTQKDLHNLAELARIRLLEEQEKNLAEDLAKILKHVEVLKEADTAGVKPVTGGTWVENVWREDNGEQVEKEAAIKAFPEAEEKFLKVPPVFE